MGLLNPRYWSLDSVYKRLKYGKATQWINPEDLRCYLMLKPQGKTILDVGAWEGDTAKLFLDHGAKKVICVERDHDKAKKITDPRTEVFAEDFSPLKHLFLDGIDGIKVDIEGYELLMVPYLYRLKKPIVIESHNHYNNEIFKAQGFEFLSTPQPMGGLCLMGRDLE